MFVVVVVEASLRSVLISVVFCNLRQKYRCSQFLTLMCVFFLVGSDFDLKKMLPI